MRTPYFSSTRRPGSVLRVSSTIAPVPLPERISRAQVIVVGRYVYFGLAGVADSVEVDHVVIDRRSAALRNEVPPHRLEYLSGDERRSQTGYTGRRFFLWFKDRKGLEPRLYGSALLPTTIEECDWMLDQLSDSLAKSRNPNFAAIARYMVGQRDQLPLARDHAARNFVPSKP